jgi:amino acid permease
MDSTSPPQQRQGHASPETSEAEFQLSVPSGQQDRVESATTHSAQPVVEEDVPEPFEIRVEKSNADDHIRRAREFRARHIQMMALGNFPT